MKQQKNKGILGLIVGAVLVIGVLAGAFRYSSTPEEVSVKTVTVYKSPTCGCCVNYIAMLRDSGYDVEVIETEDMVPIKEQYNIPRHMESCHTSIFGDYVVEGHMPLEVVEQLLEEKPDISGIALPDMPAGSPGMPGVKKGEWTIYSLTDGNVKVYERY